MILSDKMKVVLKSRLKHETTLTSVEDSLTFAALVCGLVERGAEGPQDAGYAFDWDL